MKNSRVHTKARIWLNSFLIAGLVLLLRPALHADALPILGIHHYVSTSGEDKGTCSSTSTACATINYAIEQAATGDTIHIAAGTYYQNVDLSVSKNLVFSGAGRDLTIVDGGGTDRVFAILAPVDVKINDLTIMHGNSNTDNVTACGGGVAHNGGTTGASLELVRVWITENIANCGAGIYTTGSITITNSTISNNSANVSPTSWGGAMYLNGIDTNATLTNVTISGNLANGTAGGIDIKNHYETTGTTTLTNVTITDNNANANTAMNIYNEAHVIIINSTIANNHRAAEGYPGGISNMASVTIKNSILAGNEGTNCYSPVGTSATWTSEGNNIDSGASCQFNNVSKNDHENTDPLLGPLAFNGGLVKTMGLLLGSPAIDGVIYNAPNGCPASDGRLLSRPFGQYCDIGAFEFNGFALYLPFILK